MPMGPPRRGDRAPLRPFGAAHKSDMSKSDDKTVQSGNSLPLRTCSPSAKAGRLVDFVAVQVESHGHENSVRSSRGIAAP